MEMTGFRRLRLKTRNKKEHFILLYWDAIVPRKTSSLISLIAISLTRDSQFTVVQSWSSLVARLDTTQAPFDSSKATLPRVAHFKYVSRRCTKTNPETRVSVNRRIFLSNPD
jgi:hypothetical protein